MKQVLFKVIQEDGHEFTIYTNGEIDGFAGNPIICNYHPTLMRIQRAQQQLASGVS